MNATQAYSSQANGSTALRSASLRGAVLGILLCMATGIVVAADYPTKPLRYVVGFAAGGGADISCRYWGQKLTAITGQPVVVENRPGAASELAVKNVMAAAPDGYSLLCTTASAGILSGKLNPPFDLRTALAPVIQMTRFTFAFYVSPGLPVKTMSELIAYAKARPGKLNYGSVGIGSTPHLAMELFKAATGIYVVHIPFKGTAQAVVAVMGGEIEIGLDAAAALRTQFESGKLKPLAVISAKRSPALPNVMGMQEAGVPGVDVIAWTGLTAPARTPRDIIDVLNKHYNAILLEPEVKKVFFDQGYETGGGTPEDLGRLIAKEVTDWSKVIKDANIVFD